MLRLREEGGLNWPAGRPAHLARGVRRPRGAAQRRDQPPLLQPTPSKEGQARGVSVSAWGRGSWPKAAVSSGQRKGHQRGRHGQRGPAALPCSAQEGQRAPLPPLSEPGRETAGPRQSGWGGLQGAGSPPARTPAGPAAEDARLPPAPTWRFLPSWPRGTVGHAGLHPGLPSFHWFTRLLNVFPHHCNPRILLVPYIEQIWVKTSMTGIKQL